MRIVVATNQLLPADKEGGPAYSNFYLSQALKQAGADVRVVTTDRNGPERLAVPTDTWTERDGVPVFYARTDPGAWIRSRSYAAAVTSAAGGSDVCIMSGIFWNHTGLAAWRACRGARLPYLTMPRGLLSPWALAHKGLKKAVYWKLLARRIVDGSAALIALAEQELRDIRGARVDRPVHVVPNGAALDDDVSSDAHGAPDALAAVDGARRYVLFLGRIHPKKGLDLLVPAFDRVARQFPDVALVVAGSVDAEYATAFDAVLAGSAFRSRIVLTGNVSGAHKARLVRGAAAFALTSYSEGMPVAVLEALSAGVPVVLTAECNVPEVAASDAGIEVPLQADAAAAALARLLSDPALRERMAANARALAQSTFSWSSVGRRVHDICATVARR